MSAGYSGTTLAQKLGLRADTTVALLAAPDGFEQLLAPVPDGVRFTTRARPGTAIAVYFTTSRAQLARRIPALGRAVHPDGAVWVAWPKKSSGARTDITEDVIRAVVLPLGLVDNKVCAIDAVWSGLRLVWRRSAR